MYFGYFVDERLSIQNKCVFFDNSLNRRLNFVENLMKMLNDSVAIIVQQSSASVHCI